MACKLGVYLCLYVCTELGEEENGIQSIKDPLQDVKAGLLDSSGQQLPLQAVHVKCKLMDLLSQVGENAAHSMFSLYFVNTLPAAELTGSYLSIWQYTSLLFHLLGHHFPTIHQPELCAH